MNLWNETKSVPISRAQIWSAYKKVKANKGSAGVDSVNMEEFDVDRSKHLYKLWNRMASGSYFTHNHQNHFKVFVNASHFHHQLKRLKYPRKTVKSVSLVFQQSATGWGKWW